MRRVSGWWIAASVLLLPCVAMAHPGHGLPGEGDCDFAAGFLHPLTGWDHLLAMLAVGLWAAQLGSRAMFLLPAAFLGMMCLGGTQAAEGVKFPAIETGIVSSLLALGLLIVFSAKLPVWSGVLLVSLFALFHGAAHGQELAGALLLTFGSGALLATALLHGAGAMLGLALRTWNDAIMLRITGGAIAAAGILMMVGIL